MYFFRKKFLQGTVDRNVISLWFTIWVSMSSGKLFLVDILNAKIENLYFRSGHTMVVRKYVFRRVFCEWFFKQKNLCYSRLSLQRYAALKIWISFQNLKFCNGLGDILSDKLFFYVVNPEFFPTIVNKITTFWIFGVFSLLLWLLFSKDTTNERIHFSENYRSYVLEDSPFDKISQPPDSIYATNSHPYGVFYLQIFINLRNMSKKWEFASPCCKDFSVRWSTC